MSEAKLDSSPVYIDLVCKLDEYICFLETSENKAFSIAKAHGYVCPLHIVERGIVLRSEIEKLRKAL